MKYIKGIFTFLYDFIIGDDWKIAAAVLAALVVTLGLALAGAPIGVTALLGGLLIAGCFVVSVVVDVRS